MLYNDEGWLVTMRGAACHYRPGDVELICKGDTASSFYVDLCAWVVCWMAAAPPCTTRHCLSVCLQVNPSQVLTYET